jgi:glycosyltransferase involved in cell wall biosynthesis
LPLSATAVPKLHIAGRNPGHYFKDDPPQGTVLEGEVEDALEFFSSHQVMLVPLLSGSGIRIKILEAMAMAKTVICTPIAAEGLKVSSGKQLFIAETPEQFAEILLKLSREPGLLSKTGRNARKFINENFDNLELSESLISFYKKHLA